MSDLTNQPEPKTRADRIAAKAIELLDQDNWLYVDNYQIVIRDVTFWRDGWAIIIPDQEAKVLQREKPSQEFVDLLREAFLGAMSRKRISLTKPLEERITNDNWLSDKRAQDRKARHREARKTLAAVGVILVGVFVLFGGIVSCVQHSENVRMADLNQVNEFGFRKGDFPYNKRWEYPSGCARNGMAVHTCKSQLSTWERRGQVWVTWEDQPND